METILSLRVHVLLRFKSARCHISDFRTLGKVWFPIKTFWIEVVCGHPWRPLGALGRKQLSTSTMLGPCCVQTLKNYLVQAGLLDSKKPERKVGHVSTAWVPLSQSQKDISAGSFPGYTSAYSCWGGFVLHTCSIRSYLVRIVQHLNRRAHGDWPTTWPPWD